MISLNGYFFCLCERVRSYFVWVSEKKPVLKWLHSVILLTLKTCILLVEIRGLRANEHSAIQSKKPRSTGRGNKHFNFARHCSGSVFYFYFTFLLKQSREEEQLDAEDPLFCRNISKKKYIEKSKTIWNERDMPSRYHPPRRNGIAWIFCSWWPYDYFFNW